MRMVENIRIGYEGVMTHKLRSFLTMLGIIFGVGAVVAMLSIGEGARLEALKQIELMGMNNIIVKDSELEDEALQAWFFKKQIAFLIRHLIPGGRGDVGATAP